MNYEQFVIDANDLKSGVKRCEQNVELFTNEVEKQKELKIGLLEDLQELQDQYPAWYEKYSNK